MPMFKYVIWAIVFYILIRFIFNFVIPVFRATRRMKAQVREFQEKMNEQSFQSANPNPASEKRAPEKQEGDYIDFEEVRERS
jgi:hypothetical protein